MSDAFGSWMNKFTDGFIQPVVDYGNAAVKTYDITKEAVDRFGLTPFLEAGFGNPLTVKDFFNDDQNFNYLTDTVLGNAVAGLIGGDQSVLDAILNGSYDYSGFLSSLGDAGIAGSGAAGSGQPVNNNNAAGIGGAAIDPSVNDYINAELAKFYGMDRNTAYQEALANTSYQRAVKDMQAAGLNPAAIFGNGRGSTASGVGYVGSAGSASRSGSSSSKLFERDTYGMIAALSGLATAVITKRPQNFWLGQQAAQGIMQTLNVMDRKYNK